MITGRGRPPGLDEGSRLSAEEVLGYAPPVQSPGGLARAWRPIVGLAAVALFVGASCVSAARAYGTPFPSFWVDPYGDFSVVFLPSWRTEELGLAMADRVESVEGVPLRQPSGALAGGALDHQLRIAKAAGGREAKVTVRRGQRVFERNAPIRTIGMSEIWWFWGVYLLSGLAILWSGVLAFRIAGRRPAGAAHLALSVSAFLFLGSFFDYHTTRLLRPLFAVASLGNAVGLVAVALLFPSPLPLASWAWRGLRGALAVSVLAMVVLALDTFLGFDARPLRLAVNGIAPVPLLILGIVMVARLRSSTGRDRRELISSLWGLGAFPFLLGLAYLVMAVTTAPIFHVLLPFGVIAFPLAVTYSLVKHNILRTDRVLTRAPFTIPAVLCAVCLGGSVWALAWQLEPGAPFTTATFGVLFTIVAGYAAWKAVERLAFPASSRFRPTVERFADRLTVLRDADVIRSNLSTLVEEWLGVESVQVLSHAQSEVALQENGREAMTAHGTAANGNPSALWVPMRVAGELFGALAVPAKSDGAPFNSDELALLETLSSLGAVGLRNALALQELQELRTLERRMGLDGQRLAIDLLASELAHEIAYPLAYFRHLLTRLSRDQDVRPRDLEIGQDEVERLQRMLASMRKLHLPDSELSHVSLEKVVERAIDLVSAYADHRIDVESSTSTPLQVIGNPDHVLQLLANLLRNAMQAVPVGGSVVVRLTQANDEVLVDVCDNGPGVAPEVRDVLFQPFATSRPGGTGIGLAISERLARGFGWTLEYHREEPWSVFRIRAPIAQGGVQ